MLFFAIVTKYIPINFKGDFLLLMGFKSINTNCYQYFGSCRQLFWAIFLRLVVLACGARNASILKRFTGTDMRIGEFPVFFEKQTNGKKQKRDAYQNNTCDDQF
jgi:hypothetical protein